MPIGDPPSAGIVGGTMGAHGWECPRCHATFAPWVASCVNCKPLPSGLRERMDTGANGPLPLVEGGGTSAA